jgi:hypothetical protein
MSVTISVNEGIFAFTSGLTFREYIRNLTVEQRLFLERRYEAVRISPAIQSQLATYPLWLYWVLLVNNETPDTLMVLPIVQRLAELCPRIDLRILSDEADMAALNELVDDEINLDEDLAEIDMPHLFIFDEEWNQQAQWGPRPQAAEDRLDQWLSAHPDYEPLLADDDFEDPERLEALIVELTDQMRLWYNDDLTAACAAEIATILEALQSEETE